jgi:hypothetical protein
MVLRPTYVERNTNVPNDKVLNVTVPNSDKMSQCRNVTLSMLESAEPSMYQCF